MRTHEDGWIVISQWLVFFAGLGLIAVAVMVAVILLLDRWL